jgi:hypothetical protein
MSFFDSFTSIMGGVSGSKASELAEGARLNLGNIFLPGGMSGGATNTAPPGGFGNSPLNQKDWEALNNKWGEVRSAANYDDIAWDKIGGNPLSAEAQGFVKNNWGTIRPAAQLSHIDWSQAVGAPGYAPQPGAPGAAPTGPDTLSNIGGFNQVAKDQLGQVGQNNQANILELLRTQAQPYEQQAQNRLNNNLFMRGRLGGEDSVTGEAYRGFSRGLAEADTGRQIAAMGMSDQLQTGSMNRALGATQGAGALTSLSTLPFDMALKLAMAKSGANTQAAGVATSGTGLLDMWSKFMGGGR